jgi:hypothetical protein
MMATLERGITYKTGVSKSDKKRYYLGMVISSCSGKKVNAIECCLKRSTKKFIPSRFVLKPALSLERADVAIIQPVLVVAKFLNWNGYKQMLEFSSANIVIL